MGQGRSCIQGNPDWLGPYEKPVQKSAIEKDVYERVGELILLGTLTKDYTALEEFLTNKSPKIMAEKFKDRKPSNVNSFPTKCSTTAKAMQLEDMIRKDNQYKSVNFSNESDTKPSNIKPVITSKQCTLHRSTHKAEIPSLVHHHKHYPDCPLSRRHVQSRPESTAKRVPLMDLANQPAKHMEKMCEAKKKDMTTSEKAIFQEKLNAAMPRQQQKIERTSDLLQESDFPSVDSLLELFPMDTNPDTKELKMSFEVQSAKETIQHLEDRAGSIVQTFGVVLKHMEYGDWSTFCISTSRLCDDIREVLRNNIPADASETEVKIRNHVTSTLNQMTAKILEYNLSNNENATNLLPFFRTLGEVLHELVEFLIGKELTGIIENLQTSSSNYTIQIALCTIAEMSMSGSLMAKLITQAGGVQTLLNIALLNTSYSLQLLAMRTLVILCANEEAISQFLMAAGLTILARMMSSELDESLKNEATAILAHITKQCSQNQSIMQKMTCNMDKMVALLIEVAQKTISSESFLLAAASLSTMSSYNADAEQWVKAHEKEIALLNSSFKQESYV